MNVNINDGKPELPTISDSSESDNSVNNALIHLDNYNNINNINSFNAVTNQINRRNATDEFLYNFELFDYSINLINFFNKENNLYSSDNLYLWDSKL